MAGFAYYVIQRNDTINDSIFFMSNGMQGVYSKMLGVVWFVEFRMLNLGTLELCGYNHIMYIFALEIIPVSVSWHILRYKKILNDDQHNIITNLKYFIEN